MFRFIIRRDFSSKKRFSSAQIRQTFLDYFIKDHGHTFVKSSSVIPHQDPTVAFVNAGMNQFKSVLLGVQQPSARKVANSQKCIRVGGKHNDLESVGQDGTHHTFFEMLGNWSFGDYFKAEACSLAWKFLTETLGMNPKNLIITYFGGDSKEQLLADEECLEIWKSLGVPNSNVIPRGMKDNFWEMGPVGPCGPCTEIHLKQSNGELLELWNLVFIEFERTADGTLIKLPMKHVDTGMGLERITKVIQKVPTNYDTDLFMPLFSYIHKVSNAPQYQGKFGPSSELDVAYRILADHSRAVSVALADGMFPDQNHKLRRLLRRCFQISAKVFKYPGPDLTSGLVSVVTDVLGPTYPELKVNYLRTLGVIANESNIFDITCKLASVEWNKAVLNNPKLAPLPSDLPGLLPAINELKGKTEIDGNLAFKLYDTYGLDTDVITDIGRCLHLSVDFDGMQKCIESQQESSRMISKSIEQILMSKNVPATDDSFKYKDASHLECESLVILNQKNITIDVATNKCKLVLDKTCLYAEAGGQVSDQGYIITETGKGRIEDVKKLGQYIIHYITVTEGEIKNNTKCKIKRDEELRLNAMQHHSATHLLNSALHSILLSTYQRSSHVTPNYLTFDFAISGSKTKLDHKDIKYLENYINQIIKSELTIERKLIKLSDVPSEAFLIPGEHYPDDVYVLSIMDSQMRVISMEPCCGTHCKNTKDIIDFCIISERSSGSGVRSIKALAGSKAVKAKKLENKLNEELNNIEISVTETSQEHIKSKLQEIKFTLTNTDIPLVSKYNFSERLSVLEENITHQLRTVVKSYIEEEIRAKLYAEPESKFIVHLLQSPNSEPVPLDKANNVCLPERASLIFAIDEDDIVRARCTVPEKYINENFSAELWLQPIAQAIGAPSGAPKGQDPRLVYNMKAKRIPKAKTSSLLSIAISDANNFVELFLK